jgi:hypothetical protein
LRQYLICVHSHRPGIQLMIKYRLETNFSSGCYDSLMEIRNSKQFLEDKLKGVQFEEYDCPHLRKQRRCDCDANKDRKPLLQCQNQPVFTNIQYGINLINNMGVNYIEEALYSRPQPSRVSLSSRLQ